MQQVVLEGDDLGRDCAIVLDEATPDELEVTLPTRLCVPLVPRANASPRAWHRRSMRHSAERLDHAGVDVGRARRRQAEGSGGAVTICDKLDDNARKARPDRRDFGGKQSVRSGVPADGLDQRAYGRVGWDVVLVGE